MAFIPVPNTVQININQRLHGERVQNTLYGVTFGGITPAGLELLAGEVITWVGTALYPALSNDLSLAEVQVRDLTVADGAQFIATPSTLVNGESVSAALPGNVAACISFRTGLTGRSRRGRNYVAGLTEASVQGNQLVLGTETALRTAYEALLGPGGPFVGAGFAWVVVSRYSGVNPVTREPIPREVGQTTFVSSVQTDGNVDSQRRRLAGRGA